MGLTQEALECIAYVYGGEEARGAVQVGDLYGTSGLYSQEVITIDGGECLVFWKDHTGERFTEWKKVTEFSGWALISRGGEDVPQDHTFEEMCKAIRAIDGDISFKCVENGEEFRFRDCTECATGANGDGFFFRREYLGYTWRQLKEE